MAYADFKLGNVIRQFGLTIDETTDLFASVPAVALRPDFQAQLTRIGPLALRVSTEKARSEFLIAPILAELWLLNDQNIGVLSGVEFDVDESEGLNGFCDYIITRSPELILVRAPILMMVEAKNEDMKKGYAQCIAEMIAAQRFNEQENSPTEKMYGVVTIGEKWKFMELEGSTVRIDAHDYYIEHLDKILGILLHLTA
jgi:hypothetical protein